MLERSFATTRFRTRVTGITPLLWADYKRTFDISGSRVLSARMHRMRSKQINLSVYLPMY